MTTVSKYERILNNIARINQQKFAVINLQNQELGLETNQESNIDDLKFDNPGLELEGAFVARQSRGQRTHHVRIDPIEYDKKIGNLMKMYTDEAKYSDENDSFLFKLTMFYDICRRAEISEETKLNVFFIMLKELTLNYYYAHLNISKSFDEACIAMRLYFERTEYKRNVLRNKTLCRCRRQ
jgi:hypothetical protein